MLEVSRVIIGPIIVFVCEKTAEVGIEPPEGWQATVRTSAFMSAKHMTISGTK